MTRLVLAGLLLLAVWVVSAAAAPRAEGCAFARVPTTYEAASNRGAYLAALDIAAYNQLFPTDNFFGTPRIDIGTRDNRRFADQPYIPPTLLKASGYIESGLTQGARATPFNSVGPALVSFDCGHGIMQVTSGMTSPADSGWPSLQQALVATHFMYNVGRGAAILADKWNGAPEYRPIAGTDTDSDPTIVENWYFAVWSYNGFTGPGANRSNHPSDPDYAAWPRTGYSCGPASDGYGHSYSDYPYQEIVFGCAARPPSVSGTQLWAPLPLSLPDLSDKRWSGPLSLTNWPSCAGSSNCAAMDIPSPAPYHHDDTPPPATGAAAFLLGEPVLLLSRQSVSGTSNQITISNAGSGVLAWRARPGQSWITIDKQAGVALGQHVPCSSTCERTATLTITVTNQQAASGYVDIVSLVTGETARVQVFTERFDVNCDGMTSPVDALLVLQYSAELIDHLDCHLNADANADGQINALDAALILQFTAGFEVPTPTPTPAPTPAPTPPPTP